MGTQPHMINLGGFPLVVPEGKVVKFAQFGTDPSYDMTQVPPVLGPSVIVLRAVPVLDWDGHQYGIDLVWMEDSEP